ncbi:MAG: zinc ribbon-containing protein [Gammaproteobacteria bacterium]|jgi:predicted RNA-binding Zn-ribbon protein involved in translation (DUF1610 family)|nr:zinc ribbon-containing protein [Gammaproteobacteria bacterium]MBT7306933.1 zinc ribbon-containing protein [Gammaproteobacteria bacterium]
MSSEKESTLIHIYHTLRDHLQDSLTEGREQIRPLQQLVDESKEKLSELDEKSREEGEQIGRYLQRDLEAAGNYLTETGEDLGRWFHMEETLIEDRLKELFAEVADPTRIALTRLDAEARAAQIYLQGEVIDMGKLECIECGETLQFSETTVIPDCPKCGGSSFRRREGEV